MVFSSIAFLCVFFPVVFLLHWMIPMTPLRNCILILASLVFYAYGEPVFVVLLLFSVLINYLFGLGLSGKNKKSMLAMAVIINLLLLGVFKYAAFAVTSLNVLLPQGLALPVPDIRLPIGISFYTFQALSYLVDVYRGETPAQKSFFKLLLYISFFPQLIAGPIVKYHDIDQAISERKVTLEGVRLGLIRFTAGLGKKVLIANTMAMVADELFKLGSDYIGFVTAWIAALAYLMQIYFDFSGYSDMAIGLGKIFGFSFLENFDHPYISLSIREFWRRWHISLSSWFRDYLYIPLGGNRKGKRRTIINKYIVFLATGIWHGANWTFLLWGLYHGTLMMLEDAKIIPVHKNWKIFNRIYTLAAVTFGFVLFRADTLAQAGYFMAAMLGFGARGVAGLTYGLISLNAYVILIFIIAVIGATDLPLKLSNKLLNRAIEKNSNNLGAWEMLRMAGCLVVLLLTLMALASNSYNPFIYFRF